MISNTQDSRDRKELPPSFSLGSTSVTQPKDIALRRNRPVRRRLFLPLTTFVFALFFLLLIGSIAVGVHFTRSLHFENRSLSLFDGIKIVGQSVLGTNTPLSGETDGRINILLLGRAGEKYPGHNLTDTIMILSLNIKDHRTGLLSLPRDLFAPIPETHTWTKLNALYQIGVNEKAGITPLEESITEITGLPIHYYVLVDFDGFEQMIDALGGIRVDVKRAIHDERYPGKNYSYETFDLATGWQTLDGKTALKYVRERHDDPEGDFGRAKRQQQIMQVVRDKVWSLPTLLNPFVLSNFLASLGESVTTDIPPETLGRFLSLAREFDTKNVATVVIDAWKRESLLRVSHVDVNGIRAFVLVPRSGNWDEIHHAAQNLFDQSQFDREQAEIAKEKATIVLYATPRNRASAEAFANDIRSEYPATTVSVQIPPRMDETTEIAMIQDRSSLRVPFTLNSLKARYNLEVHHLIPFALEAPKTKADLALVYTLPTFTNFKTLSDPDVDLSNRDNDFPDILSPISR